MAITANKILFGVSKLYYAVATEADDGTLTFGTPVSIPGAVNLKLDPEGDTLTEYADNGIWTQVTASNGYKGSLEVECFPDSFRSDCLGETIDSVNGVVTESALANPSHFALMGEFSGDKKARKWVYYYCLATRPGADAKTKADKLDPMHESVDLAICPRSDDSVVMRYTNESVTDAIAAAWYTTVFDVPCLSSISASSITATAASVSFKSNKAGTYYYMVCSAATAAPTAAQIIAGETSVSSGNGAALASTNTISVTGLSASTAYTAYIVVKDTNSIASAVGSVNIMTIAA
jgi:phage major tail protein, phi13 family